MVITVSHIPEEPNGHCCEARDTEWINFNQFRNALANLIACAIS